MDFCFTSEAKILGAAAGIPQRKGEEIQILIAGLGSLVMVNKKPPPKKRNVKLIDCKPFS